MVDPQTIFQALADPTRQKLLTVLGTHELAVSELVEVLRQPQSTISRHLKVLREAGLIRDERQGTTVTYSVRPLAGAAQDADGLAGRILEWAAEQPLDAPVHRRLNSVVDHRRAMSDRFFGGVGQHWDTLREEAFGRRFQLEAMLALLPRDWVVADIGTGTGYLMPVLVGHFKRVLGVDPVETMLQAAAERVSGLGARGNVVLKQGDLSRLPIRAASVDLALAVLVLHHVPHPPQAVAELSRIVRPGGRVLIVEQTIHENEHFRERMQDRWQGFDSKELAQLLANVGFGSVSARMLTTVEPSADAPELFVITGEKAERNRLGLRKRTGTEDHS